jgi:DnaJ-class molecular chaperone
MSLDDRLTNIEEALENYREYRTSIEDLETDVMYLKEGLNKLRKEFESKLDVDMDKWKQYFSEVFPSKKPYRCPICEGRGLVFLMMSITESNQATCDPCQGKGIVWG